HIHSLSLHDALPIYRSDALPEKWALDDAASELRRDECLDALGDRARVGCAQDRPREYDVIRVRELGNDGVAEGGHRASNPSRAQDRKSTRLNSSHVA